MRLFSHAIIIAGLSVRISKSLNLIDDFFVQILPASVERYKPSVVAAKSLPAVLG